MDLGSWVETKNKTSKTRTFKGLSKDVELLQNLTYDDLPTGSSAFCVDTGDIYIYEKTTKEWNKLP